MDPQPNLETERLILRPFRLSDAKRVQLLAGSKEIATYTNMPNPYLDGVAEDWINTHESVFQDGKGAVFAITLKDNGELIGAISLININKTSNHAAIGFWIGVPYWNNGYCTEAGKAILRYGFTERGLNRLYASYMSSNYASGRVLEKLGMIYEGTQRQHITKLGEYEDLDLVGILKSEWERLEAK
jgi:ribosomal-protein-alanine N-acetyltransferase